MDKQNKAQINMRIPGMRRPRSFGMVEKPKDGKKSMLKLMSYFSCEKKLIIYIVLVVSLYVVCTVTAPWLQSRAIDIISEKKYSAVSPILIVMLVFYALSSLSRLFQDLLGAVLSQKTVKRIREDLFKKIVRLPIKYIDNHTHGDIMSRMTNDVENISNMISQSLSSLISGIFTVLLTVIMMLKLCFRLAVLSCSTVILTLIVTKYLSKIMRKFFLKRQILLGSLNGIVEEKVTAYKTVAAYSRHEEVVREFEKNSDELTKIGITAEILGGSMGPIMNFINNIGFVIIAAFGGYFAIKGITSIGIVSAFIIYAKQFGRPINEIANIYGQIQTAVAGAERIFDIIEQQSEDRGGSLNMDNAKGIVNFKNVNFSYKEGRQVLFDFNLDICAGQKVALVGATGSGKTTVVNLLMRFYDIDSGEILIDGINIKDMNIDELRKNIAVVLQDTVLFSDTIKNNLKYSNPNADDEAMLKASRASNCYNMIRHMPDKFDTVLTQEGQNLSQGQRQLLSIARAFLAEPKILILDEATSSVDTRTEKYIQDAMVNLMKERTSLIIAHRLSTIQDADIIVVLDNGRIIETGNHDQLIEKKGKYYELYMTQFEGNVI